MKKEKCVLCGKETAIEKNTHIDLRPYYVEGAGQCCEKCWHKLNDSVYDKVKEAESEKEPEMNIAKEAILALYIVGLLLLLSGSIDNMSEPHSWLYFGGLLAYALLGYIVFRNSNFNLNNKA